MAIADKLNTVLQTIFFNRKTKNNLRTKTSAKKMPTWATYRKSNSAPRKCWRVTSTKWPLAISVETAGLANKLFTKPTKPKIIYHFCLDIACPALWTESWSSGTRGQATRSRSFFSGHPGSWAVLFHPVVTL